MPGSLNDNFKIQLFRFVDVLPYSTTAESLSRHGETGSNLDWAHTLYVPIESSRLYSQATPADFNSFIKVFSEFFAPILCKFKEIGAPDYLLQFMDPRVVTENTRRREFAPVSGEDNWI